MPPPVTTTAPDDPGTGEEWAYRRRDGAPSERVLVHGVTRTGRSARRFEIEFLDGPHRGTRDTVPRGRLRVPWEHVGAYEDLMAHWQRLRAADDLDEVENSAVNRVFELLIPIEVAEPCHGPVESAVEVHDPAGLETLTGVSPTALAEQHDSFQLEGTLILASAASLVIAEHACRRNPQPVLDSVLADEAEARQKSKRGGTGPTGQDDDPVPTSPEHEYRFYRAYHRPRHELLRQWCGHRAVTAHERLLAAEAECHRLDELLARTLDALRAAGSTGLADGLEREHETERITADTIRPVPERPLHPSELPVREVPRRRWWS